MIIATTKARVSGRKKATPQTPQTPQTPIVKPKANTDVESAKLSLSMAFSRDTKTKCHDLFEMLLTELSPAELVCLAQEIVKAYC
jgi:hypothetical protein